MNNHDAEAPLEGAIVIGIARDRCADEAARIENLERGLRASGLEIAGDRLPAALDLATAADGLTFILAKGQDLKLRKTRSEKQNAQLALIMAMAKEMRATRTRREVNSK
jgi:hypothetical protein